MVRVLVIGDDLRSFLAIVRSLGRNNIVVHAAPFDFSSPALASKYVAAVHRLPPYALGAQDWLAELQHVVTQEKIDLIIPCDDRSVLPLHHHRADLSARVAVPNDEAMLAFFDKCETRALATACGVPIAHGGPISEQLVAEIGLPLAVKPRRSMQLSGIGQRGAVSIVRDDAALAKALASAQPPGEYFLEAFFVGDGVGLSVLADRGDILQAFQHRRLQEASETGGSSSRVSEAIHPALMSAVAAMCQKSRLTGVAMFEFRHDRVSDGFILLEVNARFWGSLPLAVASGVEFPVLLCALLSGTPSPERCGYQIGVQRRDYSGEYYRILLEAERGGSVMMRATALMVALPQLWFAAARRPQQFDSYAVDDLAPWRGERGRVRAALVGAVSSRLPVNARARAQRSRQQLAEALAERPLPRILFVCHGNICRSPFAAIALSARLGHDVIAESAGTIPRVGRPSPDDARAAALAHAVDVGSHRSRYVKVDTAKRADVIFIFDNRNALELSKLGIMPDKIIRLGDLIGKREILDPYGHGRAAFDRCYAEIDAAIDIIAAVMRAR